MGEYIERDKLLDDFELCNKQNPRWTPQRVKSLLVRANAADVVEVKQGRWITDEKGVAYCGRCRIVDDYASVHNYCPNCGARLDGEI